MKYEITWSENKTTSTGKRKMEATLKDEQGHSNKVTIWEDFPNFNSLMTGHTVEGVLKPSRDPKYAPSLSPMSAVNIAPKSFSRATGAGSNNPSRDASIKEAQERKSESISYFNSVNSAIALLQTTIYQNTEMKTKEFIVEWRDWFISEYEKWNKDLPTKNPPF